MNESSHSPAGAPDHPVLQSQTRLPPRILVVEDDDVIRRLTAHLLTRFGYEVARAADGAAGWEALNAGGYDLLITDNEMPGLSGLELLRKLRTAGMTLPVIMAAGRIPAREFALHPWLRPEATLLKPYGFADLLRTVKTALHAADGQPAPAPDWPDRPASDDLQLDWPVPQR